MPFVTYPTTQGMPWPVWELSVADKKAFNRRVLAKNAQENILVSAARAS